MSQTPELYTVLSAAELTRLLQQALPAGTQVAWQRFGLVQITAGKLGIADAGGLHPNYPSEVKTLDWPFTQCEFWAQWARTPDGGADRIFAVLALLPGIQPGQTQSLQLNQGRSLAIDSATAAFGDQGRMLREMRAGGPASHTCLGRGSASDEAKKLQRTQAADYLRQHGFPVHIETHATGSISVRFQPGLTDQQVHEANELLAQVGCPDQVWIAGSHTSGLLEEALSRQVATQLTDAHGPYLFACRTGFGDGIYYWDALSQAGSLCGYLCNFVPAEE